jgi:hypothetical protein
MTSLIAVDDGIFSGNFNLADICFLVAFIVFVIAFVVKVIAKPLVLDAVLIAAGLACLALGWLVL